MTARTTIQYIIALGFGFCIAVITSNTLSKRNEARETSEEGQSDRGQRSKSSLSSKHRAASQRPPAVNIVSIKSRPTRRELMIREDPQTGFITWGNIERAERELIQPDLALYLGEGDSMGLDCFNPDQVSPEFSYELSVVVTPDSVSVGEFKITDSELSSQTNSCLEELFAGTVTLDLDPGVKSDGLHYQPVNTTLRRESNFVTRVTRDLAKNGRERIQARVQENLLQIPQDQLIQGLAP